MEPKIIRLDQNRVDVVFEVNDGTSTLVSRIAFVGNHAFSESKLREIVASRQQAFYRFLSSSDTYDPARVDFDKELLRRFYLRNGYADFEVRNATAELAPDRSSFFVTFTLNEGAQYKVNSIKVDSRLPRLNGDTLLPDIEQEKGETYDGEAVERSVTALQDAAQARGYNFVSVRPPHRPRPRQAHRRPGVRRYRRAACVCRAHRHRGQHPHQGQGDPAARCNWQRGRVQRRHHFAAPAPA